VNLIPGSPAFAVYGDVPLDFANAWDESHGLNDPIWIQYWNWLLAIGL
jgi:ABC-type dipeptide/oligopeptide/nickel transport system permease component